MFKQIFKYTGLTPDILNKTPEGVEYLSATKTAADSLANYIRREGLTTPNNAIKVTPKGSRCEFVLPGGIASINRVGGTAKIEPDSVSNLLESYDAASKALVPVRDFVRLEYIFQLLYLNSYLVIENGSRIDSRVAAGLRDLYIDNGLYYTHEAHLVTRHEKLFEHIVRVAVPDYQPGVSDTSKIVQKRLKGLQAFKEAVIPESMAAEIHDLPVEIMDIDAETAYIPWKVFKNPDFWTANPHIRKQGLDLKTLTLKFAGTAFFKGTVVCYDGSKFLVPKGAIKHPKFWKFGMAITEFHGGGLPDFESRRVKFSLDGFTALLLNDERIISAINQRTADLLQAYGNDVTPEGIQKVFDIDLDDLKTDIKAVSAARKILELAEFYERNSHYLRKPVPVSWWLKHPTMRILVAMLMDKHARTNTVEMDGYQGKVFWHPDAEDDVVYTDGITGDVTIGRYPITAIVDLPTKPLSAIGMSGRKGVFLSLKTIKRLGGDFDGDLVHLVPAMSGIKPDVADAISNKATKMFREFIVSLNRGKTALRGYILNPNGTFSKPGQGLDNWSMAKIHSSRSVNLGTFNKNTQAVVLHLLANYNIKQTDLYTICFALMQFQQSAINSQGGMREDVIDFDNTPADALAYRTRKLMPKDYWEFVDVVLKQYGYEYIKPAIDRSSVEMPLPAEYGRKFWDKAGTQPCRHWRKQLYRWATVFLQKGRFFETAEKMFNARVGDLSDINVLKQALIYKIDLIDAAADRFNLVDYRKGYYSLYDINNQIRALELAFCLNEVEAVLVWLVNVHAKEADLPYYANAFLMASNNTHFYSTRALACIRLHELFQTASLKGLNPDAYMPEWAKRLEQAVDKKAEINAILNEFYEIGSIDASCDRCIRHLFDKIFQ